MPGESGVGEATTTMSEEGEERVMAESEASAEV